MKEDIRYYLSLIELRLRPPMLGVLALKCKLTHSSKGVNSPDNTNFYCPVDGNL